MRLVEDHSLKGVFPYLDNITICGKDQFDHDINLKSFMDAAQDANLKFNDSKSVFSTRRLHLVGYVIEEGTISHDPERLRPLNELPLPQIHDHSTDALDLSPITHNGYQISLIE